MRVGHALFRKVVQQMSLDLDTYFRTDGWEDDDGLFHRIHAALRRAGRGVPLTGLDTYLRYEGKAIGIRGFAAQVVPGLLQTEAYVRGLMLPGDSAETTEPA